MGQAKGLGRLLWSGEHWIAYLQDDAGSATGSVSLYHAYHSPAGEGTVAFVATPRLAALCTDNRALAEFARDRLVVRGISPIDPDATIVDAILERTGDVLASPGWTIEAGDHALSVDWSDIAAPIVGPQTANASICFTILYFAGAGRIVEDGLAIPGRAYPRDAWKKTLGRPMSSFCFALAETMLES